MKARPIGHPEGATVGPVTCDWCYDPIIGEPMTALDEAGGERRFHPADVASCYKNWRTAVR